MRSNVELVAAANEAFLSGDMDRARGKASGVTVEGRFWFLYDLAGGRITRLEAFLTREQALG